MRPTQLRQPIVAFVCLLVVAAVPGSKVTASRGVEGTFEYAFEEQWRTGPSVNSEYEYWDPIIIDISKGEEVHYKLSSPEDGAVFDLNADGVVEHVAWPEKPDTVVFLAMDRNGNGRIDDGSELFGDKTIPGATTGFAALKQLVDSNGDALIDANDPQFAKLLLWSDLNRNGVSEAGELLPASRHLATIGLSYTETQERDQHGNWYRWQGYAVTTEDKDKKVHGSHTHNQPRPVYDVFLRIRPQ